MHASYIVNLAGDPSNAMPRTYMEAELRLGSAMGIKGVVVHVGKFVKGTPETGLARMHEAVKALMESATPTCKLLLETPAGQGTELLREMSDFFDFVNEYANEESFAVVIDTCHVFAAGYEPAPYISSFISRFGHKKLALVHYNDSKCPQGAYKDRHERPGYGYIGSKRMNDVYTICQTYLIPCVME